ncbi:MAG TPA: acetoacetate decarboxylase family protein [Allocoleopsis sp.]
MAYPQAPWTLRGYALQTLQFIDIERSHPFIPPELDIISILPGKTLGGVYVSHYGSGSVLEYSELIVVGGLVRYSGKIGGWVSHIYVDNADSVAGGREIWGLPKEMAEFTWEKNVSTTAPEHRVTVRQGDRVLCSLSYSQPSFGLPLPFQGNVLSTLGTSILRFQGKFEANTGLVRSKLTIPTESPFVRLGLDQPWITAYCDRLHLIANAPDVVGQRETAFSTVEI